MAVVRDAGKDRRLDETSRGKIALTAAPTGYEPSAALRFRAVDHAHDSLRRCLVDHRPDHRRHVEWVAERESLRVGAHALDALVEDRALCIDAHRQPAALSRERDDAAPAGHSPRLVGVDAPADGN